MSITMQGPWTVGVKSKNAAFAQRFVISGATSGNGAYDGATATAPVFVTGAQWTIRIQYRAKATGPWENSAMRLATPAMSGGLIHFDIGSNDSGVDNDYDDLVLTCSLPATSTDTVLYGRVKTYAGLCRFNPCFPSDFVIDCRRCLEDLIKYDPIRKVLEELYPERIRDLLKQKPFPPRPWPEPDPAPFRPMMVPLGLRGQAEIASFDLTEKAPAALANDKMSSMRMSTATAVSRVPIGAAHYQAISPYALDFAKLRDRIKLACRSANAPGVLLRFQEYDRTSSELAGGSYSGEGDRQNLGLAVTDEVGNYIFRFSQTLADIADESDDIVVGGASLAEQLRPDVIVQAIAGGSGSGGVLWESGLYSDVPNLKRINLCIPEHDLNPGPVLSSCQGGRAIQAIGNIWTIAGVGNTFDSEGRVTTTNPTGPIITRGAFVGRLDMFACFLDRPNVTHYTIRFRRPGGGWSFVNELYRHIYIPHIGLPNYVGTQVGPFATSLAVDGGAATSVPAYKNIESDPDWVVTHRMRKIQLSAVSYAILTNPSALPFGTVDFRIEGYDSAGNKVAGADDTIRLRIESRGVQGDIASLSAGGVAPGECALFELASPGQPITMRFKVNQEGGFLQQYSVAVKRGSNTAVGVSSPAQPLQVSYSEPTHGNAFLGTAQGVSPDVAGYVEAVLTPDGGSWLPPGHTFCAFEFSVSGQPRLTDGYGVAGGSTLDLELVGIQI